MLNKIKSFNPLSNFNKAIQTLKKKNIRPTKQRMILAKLLFEKGQRHMSAENLYEEVKRDERKISLATIYNTVHAFKEKGYLKEISINSNQSYFDTNTSVHHHFFDEENNELIDCNQNDIDINFDNIKKNISGKKINSIEVLVRIASDNHNQN